MNRHAGVSQGAPKKADSCSARASIVIDVVGHRDLRIHRRQLAGGVGKAKKLMAPLVMLVVIGCALFSITSIMSFVAGEWLSVAESRKARHRGDQAARSGLHPGRQDRREAQERLASPGSA